MDWAWAVQLCLADVCGPFCDNRFLQIDGGFNHTNLVISAALFVPGRELMSNETPH